jgi:hypothetical protein
MTQPYRLTPAPAVRSALLVLLLAACSEGVPSAPIQHAPPVAFTMPTGRIAVAPVTIELPAGRGIGSYSRNVDCWVHVRSIMPTDFPGGPVITDGVIRTLTGAGLKVSSTPSSDVAAAGSADYLLVASVPVAHADLCIDSVFNAGPADIDAQVSLSWHLWSVRDRRIVYESTTTGTAHTVDPSQTIGSGVSAAVEDAARQLLQTAAFQQYLTYGKVVTPPPVVAGAASPVPAGGAAPIPTPPAGFQRPVVAETLPPILIPVRAAHPAGTAIDGAAVKAATIKLGSSASAFVLGGGYLLTATAALDGVTAGIELAPGHIVDARVIRRDDELGVALLKTDEALPPGLPIQPRRNAIGDAVFGIGPGGLIKGSVTATRASGGGDRVSLDASLQGSPVLDSAGNVIGLKLSKDGFVSIGLVFRALQLGVQPSEE